MRSRSLQVKVTDFQMLIEKFSYEFALEWLLMHGKFTESGYLILMKLEDTKYIKELT